MRDAPETDLTHRRFVLSVVARHALAVVLVVCLAMAIYDALNRVAGGSLHAQLLVVLCALAAVEAMYSRYVLSRGSTYGRNQVAYRIAEWVVMALLLKAVLYAARGFESLVQDVLAWQSDFSKFFMDGEYLVALISIVVAWSVATLLGQDLDELDVEPRQLEAERQAGLRSERASSRQHLVDHLLIIGGVVVFLMVVSRARILGVAGAQADQPAPAYVVVFFISALALLAITQFTLLRAGWLWDRLAVNSEVGGRWLAYGLIFLSLLLIAALLLPTGYSVGLLGLLGYLIGLLIAFAQLVMLLVMQVVFFFISLLAALFGFTPPERPQEPVQFEPPPPPPTNAPATADPWWEIVKSILFWAVFLAVIVYALRQMLQQRQDWVAKLRQLPGLLALLQGWRWLFTRLRGLNRVVAERIAAGVRQLRAGRSRPASAAAGRYVSLRRMSPRQRVVFYYLAMLQRGAQRGLPRETSQTPYEYERRLGADVPEVGEDVSAMTREFVEARYSQHDVTPDRAGVVRRYWDRIRDALRRRRPPPRSSP